MANQRIHKGFWLLRVFMLSASLVGILLMIEQFQKSKITFEPLVPAGAEQSTNTERGIGAKVVDDRDLKKSDSKQ